MCLSFLKRFVVMCRGGARDRISIGLDGDVQLRITILVGLHDRLLVCMWLAPANDSNTNAQHSELPNGNPLAVSRPDLQRQAISSPITAETRSRIGPSLFDVRWYVRTLTAEVAHRILKCQPL